MNHDRDCLIDVMRRLALDPNYNTNGKLQESHAETAAEMIHDGIESVLVGQKITEVAGGVPNSLYTMACLFLGVFSYAPSVVRAVVDAAEAHEATHSNEPPLPASADEAMRQLRRMMGES